MRPKSSGATDYAFLATEVLGGSGPQVIGTMKLTVPAEALQRQTTVEQVVA